MQWTYSPVRYPYVPHLSECVPVYKNRDVPCFFTGRKVEGVGTSYERQIVRYTVSVVHGVLRKTVFRVIFISDSYSDTSVCP